MCGGVVVVRFCFCLLLFVEKGLCVFVVLLLLGGRVRRCGMLDVGCFLLTSRQLRDS